MKSKLFLFIGIALMLVSCQDDVKMQVLRSLGGEVISGYEPCTELSIGILGGLSLNYKASGGQEDEDFIIKDQYPKAGAKIDKEGTVYLYRK